VVNKDFGDIFVNDVTKVDWPKVFVGSRGFSFKDKGYRGVWGGWVKMASFKGYVDKLEGVISYNVLILFKKDTLKPI